MKIIEGTTCKACRIGKLYKREVTQKFEREGLEVQIEGLPALVCGKCDQVYFPPGVGDKIADAAHHLLMLSDIKHVGIFKAVV